MTTYHPQHRTNASAAEAVRVMTTNLMDLQHIHLMRGMNISSPPSHRELLKAAAARSQPFRVRVAKLPTGEAA